MKTKKTTSLRVKSAVKAGDMPRNHNFHLLRL